MALQDALTGALKEAMKAKDQVALRALRAIKSAVLLELTKEGAGDTLSEEDEIKLLSKMVKQRKDSFNVFSEQGRDDLAAKEQEEIEVIAKFLPEQLSEEELKAGIEKIIADTGASSMADMGKVMGMASKTFAGKADGKTISGIVKALLQG